MSSNISLSIFVKVGVFLAKTCNAVTDCYISASPNDQGLIRSCVSSASYFGNSTFLHILHIFELKWYKYGIILFSK